MSGIEYEDDPFATPASEPTPADKQEITIPRGGPIAGGKRTPVASAPALPAWEDPSFQDRGDGADGDVDYGDLASLNADLLRLRIRMNRIRREMRRAAREATEAKLSYHRAFRRALVQQTGGSAESRKANAELQCEQLEAEMVMKQQVADEYNTLFRSIRDDVENAKVVAYNLRALMAL